MLTPRFVYDKMKEACDAGLMPSMNEKGTCKYRLEAGGVCRKCAVGVFLTDEEVARIDPDSDPTAYTVFSQFPDIEMRLTAGGVSSDMWTELQRAHDRLARTNQWDNESFLEDARRILGVVLLTPQYVYDKLKEACESGVLPGWEAETKHCLYRVPGSCKRCAVGLFLTDEEAEMLPDGLTACGIFHSPVVYGSISARLLADGVMSDQWQALQCAHDQIARQPEWNPELFLADARKILMISEVGTPTSEPVVVQG